MSTHYSQIIHFFSIFMISLQNICFFSNSLIHVFFCGFLWIMWINRCISLFLVLLALFLCGQNVHTNCGHFLVFYLFLSIFVHLHQHLSLHLVSLFSDHFILNLYIKTKNMALAHSRATKVSHLQQLSLLLIS